MSSLAKGSLLIAIGTIYKIILTILIDKYLAIQLGVEDYGKYKYGITIVLLIGTLSTLGFNSSIIRFIAIQNSYDKKKTIITVSLILTFLVAILIVILALTGLPFFSISSPFLYATIFFALNTLYSSIYSGLEKPNLKVWINDVFGFTIYLMLLWTFFEFNRQSEEIAYVYLAYVFLVFIVNLYFSRTNYRKVKRSFFKGVLFNDYVSYTLPLFGVSILLILSANLDKVVLNQFVSEKELGIYYSVFTISNLLPLILTILVFMYLPRMSKFIQKGKKRKATLLSSYSSKWTMVIASMFFGSIFFYGKDLISILYTSSFIEGLLVLKILVFGQWINVSLGFTGQNLLALGDSKNQLYIRLLSFFIGFGLLFFGTKYYGSIGAAFSILFALLFSNSMQILILKRKHQFIGYRRQNVYAFIIILLIGFFLAYLHTFSFFNRLHFIISLVIDVLLYLSTLLIFRVLRKKDLKALNITELG